VFAKLILVILSLGVIACVLLTVRQQRMQAVHDLANVQREVAKLDRTLAHLRLEVADRITPEKVADMARSLGELRPIGVPEAAPAPAPSGPAPGAPPAPSPTPARPGSSRPNPAPVSPR
jgi:hypothetical protein